MKGTLFEWDEDKALRNLGKHGVSFELASEVFRDFFGFETLDLESEPGEIRYLVIGMAKGLLLTVVYTERDYHIRIISAREATKHEQNAYYLSQTTE